MVVDNIVNEIVAELYPQPQIDIARLHSATEIKHKYQAIRNWMFEHKDNAFTAQEIAELDELIGRRQAE